MCVTWDFPPPAVSVTSRLSSYFLHGLQGAAAPQTQPEGIRAGKDGLAARSQPGSLLVLESSSVYTGAGMGEAGGRPLLKGACRNTEAILPRTPWGFCRNLMHAAARPGPTASTSPPRAEPWAMLPAAACLPLVGPGSKPTCVDQRHLGVKPC